MTRAYAAEKLLALGPLSLTEMQEITGWSYFVCQHALRALKAADRIRAVRRGVYEVKAWATDPDVPAPGGMMADGLRPTHRGTVRVAADDGTQPCMEGSRLATGEGTGTVRQRHVPGLSREADASHARRIDLHLPYPPSVNSYYRTVKGRILISAEGRKYRQAVADYVAESRTAAGLTGRLRVWIEAFPPDNRRRDLDNVQKALLDSLTHAGVWKDDSQIDMLSIRRCMPAGFVEVAIEEVPA